MRVLILFHGMPPRSGAPVVGQGLRAFANGEGLRSFGHEVLYCTRNEDLPPALRDGSSKPGKKKRSRKKNAPADSLAPLDGALGSAARPYSFTETPELHAVIEAVDPDVVLVEAPEDTRRLPRGRFSVVLDLYAPRILEAQYQEGTEERDAVRLFDAIQRADHFLFSNERQRHFFLPLMALSGVDCTRVVGDVVPISCPPQLPAFKKPKRFEFVAGGVFWPWADLSSGLRDLLVTLDKARKGSVRLFGGKYGIRSETTRYLDPRNKLPDTGRLKFEGMVPIDELWSHYSRASVAFDLMTPNAERSLNLSFRQVDYLRCGLPIITSPTQVISADLLEYGAGWCVEAGDEGALRDLVLQLLDSPELVQQASSNAQRLAADRYVWSSTVEPLHHYISSPERHSHGETFLTRVTREQADLWEDREDNKSLRTRVSRYQSDLDKKSAELEARNRAAEEDLADWERERRLIRDEMAQAIEFARDEKQKALVERDELKVRSDRLAGQLALVEADVRKKTAALLKAQHDREKLTEESKIRTQEIWNQAERETLKATRARDLASEQLMVARTQVDDLNADRSALKQTLEEAMRGRDQLQKEFLQNLEGAEETARKLLETARDRSAHLDAERGSLRAKLDEGSHRLEQAERELEVKQASLMESQLEREKLQEDQERRIQQVWTRANAQILNAQSETSDAEDHLLRSQVRVRELEEDVRRKTENLMQAEQERERVQQESDQQLQEVWRTANAQTIAAQKESQDLRNELAARRARIEELEEDVRRKIENQMQAEQERERIQQQSDQQLQEVWRTANAQTIAAQKESQDLRNELGLRKARIEEVEVELRSKEEALASAQWERNEAHQNATVRVEEVWNEANATVERLQEERNQALSELVQTRARVEDLSRELTKREALLQESRQAQDGLEQRFIELLQQAEERADALLKEARLQAAAELDELRTTKGLAAARIEELEYEVDTVGREIEKKNGELREAQSQRDEAHAEKRALEKALRQEQPSDWA